MKAEIRLRHSDGSWRWFEAKVSNHIENPKVRGIVGNLHDITERKRAEEALRDAHERFRSAFENAPIGMVMADLEGRITRANPAFGRILGRDVGRGLRPEHRQLHPPRRPGALQGRGGPARRQRFGRIPTRETVSSMPTATTCGCRSTSRASATKTGTLSTSSGRSRTSPRAGRCASASPSPPSTTRSPPCPTGSCSWTAWRWPCGGSPGAVIRWR